MARILVVIPAYNEEKNIVRVITELKSDFPEADILVVNDCSKDNTAVVAKNAGVVCVSHPFNMGYAHGLLTGFKYAAKENYDIVVQFDGDGQHIASEARMLADTLINEKVDIVIGSRFLIDTGFKHPFFRRIGTALFRTIINMTCKKDITDPTSGLQAVSKSCIIRFAQMEGYPEYPDANLLIDLLLDGYRIVERSVKMRIRTEGVSMHSGIWKPARYMMLMFYSIFIVNIKQRKLKKA